MKEPEMGNPMETALANSVDDLLEVEMEVWGSL